MVGRAFMRIIERLFILYEFTLATKLLKQEEIRNLSVCSCTFKEE